MVKKKNTNVNPVIIILIIIVGAVILNQTGVFGRTGIEYLNCEVAKQTCSLGKNICQKWVGGVPIQKYTVTSGACNPPWNIPSDINCRCKEQPEGSTCVDTDANMFNNAKINGTTTDQTGSYTDYCSNSNTLVEYYCTFNKVVSMTISCGTVGDKDQPPLTFAIDGVNKDPSIAQTIKIGCSNGACTKITSTSSCPWELKCIEPDEGIFYSSGYLNGHCYTGTYQCPSGSCYDKTIDLGTGEDADQLCTPIETTSVCGDGVKEGTEQCDDGNTKNGDGCNSTCRKETKGLSFEEFINNNWGILLGVLGGIILLVIITRPRKRK